MIDYKLIVLITSAAALHFALAYIDAKHKVKLLSWLNGEVASPFKTSNKNNIDVSTSLTEDDEKGVLRQQVRDLSERVQILEKIVTEPAFELKQEIGKL
ncbi:MAG: hypothetical protein WA981_16060 [Glaciecola sp.]